MWVSYNHGNHTGIAKPIVRLPVQIEGEKDQREGKSKQEQSHKVNVNEALHCKFGP